MATYQGSILIDEIIRTALEIKGWPTKNVPSWPYNGLVDTATSLKGSDSL